MTNITANDFSAGVIKDLAKHLVPDNAVVDANNVLFDFGSGGGKIRKRNGSRSCQITDHDFPLGKLSFLRSENYDQSFGLVGVYNNTTSIDVNLISENGSAARKQVTANVERIGRPYDYFGVSMYPCKSNDGTGPVFATYAGSRWFNDYLSNTGATTFATPATCVLTANVPTVPIAAADIDKIAVGMLWRCSNATQIYIGKIISVNKQANTFVVFPTPNVSVAAPTAAVAFEYHGAPSQFAYDVTGCAAGCTHQGRSLIGDFRTRDGSDYPNFLAWNSLLDENITYGGVTVYGFHAIHACGYLQYNRVPLDTNRIIAIESLSDDLALVLGDNACFIITGTLPTITAQSGSITFDIQKLSNTQGCVNDASVVKVERGVIWANKHSVFMYDGSNLIDIMDNKIRNFYASIINNNIDAIQGAALVDNKYYILSTTNRAFVFNMETGVWTFFSNCEFEHACTDFKENKTYASRPSYTYLGHGDNLFRLDTMVKETERLTCDANWIEYNSYVRSKSFSLESIINKHFRHVGANTQYKKDISTHNALGLNSKCQDVLQLPNTGLELGNVNHWYAFGSTKPTLAVDSANKRSGSYALSVVTPAVNGTGVQYYFPTMYLSTTDTLAVEVFVKGTVGTPNVTIEIGISGDVTSATAASSTSYAGFRHHWTPASSGVKTGIYVKLTIADQSDFFVDDLAAMVFGTQNWCRISNNASANSSNGFLNSEQKDFLYNYCIQCSTPAATTAEGIAFCAPGFFIPKNGTVTVRVRVKQTTAAQAWSLIIGFGSAAQTTSTTITPETTAYADFELTSNAANATYSRLYITLRQETQIARTIYIQRIQVITNWGGAGINFVAGLDGEGAFGDGSINDGFDSSSSLTDDYHLDLGSTNLTKASGRLTIGVASPRDLRIRSKECVFNSGEAIVKVNIATWVDDTHGPRFGLMHRGDSTIDGYAAVMQTNDLDIYQFSNGASGASLSSHANFFVLPNTTKEFWLRVVLEGLLMRAYVYILDPAGFNKDFLDKYKDSYAFGQAFYKFSTSGELPAGQGMLWISPVGSNELDEFFDDFIYIPYDNIATKTIHERIASYDRYSFFCISQAGAVEFRTWGGADLDVFGILMDIEDLDSTRELNA